MSLVTVLRSPSSENTSTCTDSELEEDVEEGSPRSRTSSFEGFFASKGTAFALPDGDFARKASKHGGEMQMHLQSMVNLLRDDDILRLVVKLEGVSKDRVRYLTVVSAFNDDDIEESIAVGVDWVNKRATCTIGMVLPLWRDTKIELDGDGGFNLSANYKKHVLKPVSVQTMWTAVQWIYRCSENARKHNQFPNGLSHQWSNFYSSRISSDQECINEWHEMLDVSSKLIQLPTGITPEEELMMKLIRHKLKEVMMKVDLEEVTSRMIRESLEDEMKMDLKKYKQYIDEEMLTILGQLDSASKIYEHVYLGSEWNASNLEELRDNGIGYILNISREIDNFFYGTFEYLNIRVYDEEDSDLLSHWDNTYKFITQAKERGVKVLVHCKMGMSRSASTVIAYGMKEYGLNLEDTMKYVKSKRSIINPNAGFWKQLITYEGILNSSKQRFNPVFSGPGRRRTNSDGLNVRKGGKRRRSRNQKSRTVAMGEKLSVEPILEDVHVSSLERCAFTVGEEADDEDQDENIDDSQPFYNEDASSTEDILRTWEKSLTESNQGSAFSLSTDRGSDEVDDKVGVLESRERKCQPNKAPLLHRARSAPLLHETNTPPLKERTDDTIGEEVHRYTSLHEFLSGKVQKLKEDFAVHSLGRKSDPHGNLEKRSASHPTSPEEVETEEKSKEIKSKLKSTLSDPTCSVSPVPRESEKEDNGSAPDQVHVAVVHRDAQDVVKSGTVKRQSRNFEEGRVNLPWEWEAALDVLENSEQAKMTEDTPDLPSSVSEELQPSVEDEPPVGVVKLHSQKFQSSVDVEGKSIDSQHDMDSAQETSESPTSPTVEGTCSIQESIWNKEEMQRTKGLFEKDGNKVNEDTIKEKAKRRLESNTEISDNIDTEVTIDPAKVEVQKSETVNEVKTLNEIPPSEDPLPGTVRKHTQAIEDKYLQLLKSSSAESFEDLSLKKADDVTIEVSTKETKTVIDSKESDETQEGQMEMEAFDVDLLLRRVNEDIRRERESEGFKTYSAYSLEECMFEDVAPQSENADFLKEQDDESEIPRPGIVKRNTELLLGKGNSKQDANDSKVSINEDIVEVNADPAEKSSPVSSPERTIESAKLDNECDAGNGLVKRHTLVYEGVLPFPVEDDTAKRSIDDSVGSSKPEVETNHTIEYSKGEETGLGEESCGTVKTNTLMFKGNLPSDREEVESPSQSTDVTGPSDVKTRVSKTEVINVAEPNDKPQVEKSADDTAVDTSSVVNVKIRLKLLEEVIFKANERHTHRQRTTKALAELEDKRKQIELEQNKLVIENSKKSEVEESSLNVEDDASSDSRKGSDTALAKQDLGSKSKVGNDSDSEVSPCVGNVRLRTLQLEERIQGSAGEETKSAHPLRRHGSMPKTTRPVDRPVVRQRSLSDLQVGSKPSTSRKPIASTSSLDHDGQSKK